MFARVSCPTCQHKFTIPEGDMAKRHVCPNCQSPFLAGKSVAESEGVAQAQPAAQPAAQPGYAKTMLAEMAPPIKYNCPRCKAPLESPANEAGSKKPCPACGQRLQVPAAPPMPAPAAVPNLNKTMLAGDESLAPPIKYNCPKCKKPLESPAIEAGTKKNCPACGQRLQVPSAPTPTLNRTILASDETRPQPPGAAAAYAAAGAVPGAPAPAPASDALTALMTKRNLAIAASVLLLLVIVVPAIIRGGKVEDAAALAKTQQELDRLRAEIDVKKADVERQKLLEADTRRQLEDLVAKYRALEERMHDNHRVALREITDQKRRDELQDRFEAERRKFEQDRLASEKNQQRILEETKARLDESKRALEAAQQRQQTIIQQPPPVIYYPWYHPRYYW